MVGHHTLAARRHPEHAISYPASVTDRKLNSTHLIARLQLAYSLTGKEIYKEEAFRMFEEHGYLDNIQIPAESIASTPGVIYKGDHPYPLDRKSTRLNSSHVAISYAVFCLKKKRNVEQRR